MLERSPTIIAGITLVAGSVLLAAPQLLTERLGLEDGDRAIRAAGLADLILIAGLRQGGTSPSTWMFGRSALSVAQAALLDGMVSRSSRPGAVRAAAATLVGLSVIDATTGALLRRAGS